MIRVESEGPPLVSIHGAGANAGVWEPLRAPLSSFDLDAPDLPGRGDGSGPACEPTTRRAGSRPRWPTGGPATPSIAGTVRAWAVAWAEAQRTKRDR